MIDPLSKELATGAGKAAADFLQEMVGSASADKLGLPFMMELRLRSLKKQIKAVTEIQNIADKEGFPRAKINMKVMLPFLEGVGLEEEPEIEQLWIDLMTNYLDATKALSSTVYPQILKQLSSTDIEILNKCYIHDTIGVNHNKKFDSDNFKGTDLTNLVRLGLIVFFSHENPHPRIMNGYYTLSIFGTQFYLACHRTPPEKKESKSPWYR